MTRSKIKKERKKKDGKKREKERKKDRKKEERKETERPKERKKEERKKERWRELETERKCLHCPGPETSPTFLCYQQRDKSHRPLRSRRICVLLPSCSTNSVMLRPPNVTDFRLSEQTDFHLKVTPKNV